MAFQGWINDNLMSVAMRRIAVPAQSQGDGQDFYLGVNLLFAVPIKHVRSHANLHLLVPRDAFNGCR